jgi:hypothetical protein
MDYEKQTYQVFNMNNPQLYGGLNRRVGTTAKTPIKWYEYVNPQ